MFRPARAHNTPDHFQRPPRLYAALAGLLLFCLVWSLAVSFLAINDCGLTIPHQHALLGGAYSGDLAHHLMAEGSCQPLTLRADTRAPATADSAGHVLSIISLDGQINTLILLVPIAGLPLVIPGLIWHPLGSGRVALPLFTLRCIAIRPPTPPPEFA